MNEEKSISREEMEREAIELIKRLSDDEIKKIVKEVKEK